MTLRSAWKVLSSMAVSSCRSTSMEIRLLSLGMRWKRIPSGGVKPVAPPWLSSSLRSMYQSTPYWDTPKSCSRVPRAHSAAVCWYSPTPIRLPASSPGSVMPESLWT